ncbi:isoamylase early set domain-containing protein [Vibrio sp. S4M6]|uniref:isoamylase early set domain-containing protein n=1 Tax=Vibrio sinus TaxID=2946865 RepID=UPI002029B807|nr:isoamylase early set domain-containing protein [Vibrio sinus]MCL9780281.1 isoamylase early set domain-containing protein [Vibrio sinus]
MISKRFFKTKNEVEVTFEVPAEQANKSISLVADFLDWQPVEMKKVAKTKTYKYKARLPKDGQFEFRYLIDDEKWLNDPHADQYKPNGHGEDNGLVSTYQ